MIDLKKISTEERNPHTKNIDILSSHDIVQKIWEEDRKISEAIHSEIKNISLAVECAVKSFRNNGRLVYIGAGTSGRLGVLDASEMPPTFGVDSKMVVGIIAGGDFALRNPIEGSEDSTTAVIDDLKNIHLNKNDTLVGIAASGRTPYVISGIEYANSIGCSTISLSTSSNSEIGRIADIKIEAVTGPEVITGSTRMKSGTAQKMILNMISTGAMVRIGKVYENLMVDVKPANKKLKERCIKIVQEITNSSYDVCKEALENNHYNCKISSVIISRGVNAQQAKNLLEENEGVLRKVI